MKKWDISPKTKRVLFITLIAALSLVLLALVVGTIYMESMLNLINKNPDDSLMSSDEVDEFLKNESDDDLDYTGSMESVGDDYGEDYVYVPLEGDDNVINIMLIGQDRLPGEGRTRSDTMILISVNKRTKEISMTSFMRDMYVSIPGYQKNKMNATYAFGGMKLLNKTLAANFGVHVDGNIEVDFDGFMKVVDLVGGIDVNLSSAEAAYLNQYGHVAKPGINHLNGAAALRYARDRSSGGSDFGRTQRQRNVLNLIFEKCRNMNLLQLNNLLNNILPMVTTDMSNKEILNYVADLFPMLSGAEIKTQQIPVDGTYKYGYTSNGRSVLLVDFEANRNVLKKYNGVKQ